MCQVLVATTVFMFTFLSAICHFEYYMVITGHTFFTLFLVSRFSSLLFILINQAVKLNDQNHIISILINFLDSVFIFWLATRYRSNVTTVVRLFDFFTTDLGAGTPNYCPALASKGIC